MSQTVETSTERDPGAVVRHLIHTVGVASLMRLIAEVTEDEADRMLMNGDRVKAAAQMREFRIVQRAAELLRN
jgi:hypothetical protein